MRHKHLLVVHNKSNDEYFAIGYLTSKKSGDYLHNEQIKTFIEKKNDPNFIPKKEKNQYFKKFDSAKKMEKEDIKRVIFDTEYLKALSEQETEMLQHYKTFLTEKKHVYFDKSGLNKEDCLNMCKEHDKIVQHKGKHPLTDDQLKQNEENKIKQQETNALPKSNED